MKCRLVLECDAESPACRLMLAAQLAEVSARCVHRITSHHSHNKQDHATIC